VCDDVVTASFNKQTLMSNLQLARQSLTNDLETLAVTGETIREHSPVIQQWPWENGIILEHGSMERKLSNELSGSEQDPSLVSMVLVNFYVHCMFNFFYLPSSEIRSSPGRFRPRRCVPAHRQT